jgi:hypothetical protein
VRRLNPGSTFSEAVAYATGQPVPSGGYSKPSKPSKPPAVGPDRPATPNDRPKGLPLADALALVEDAERRLWTPEGRAALAYLEGRGLTEATIRAARLGWADKIRLPLRDGDGTWLLLDAVTIPWFDDGRLARIKTRRLGLFRGSRYIEAFADGWTVYPSPAAIRAGTPLIAVEGEFDALLLGQELGELASVVTTGSTSSRPAGAVFAAALRCPRWFAAHDADDSGDRAAAEWPARAVRVRPPAGKDWTEAHRAGVDLGRWWVEGHLPEAFDREERAAILEFDGGLTREEAERAAGITGRATP